MQGGRVGLGSGAAAPLGRLHLKGKSSQEDPRIKPKKHSMPWVFGSRRGLVDYICVLLAL